MCHSIGAPGPLLGVAGTRPWRRVLDGRSAGLGTPGAAAARARVSPMFEQIPRRWNGLRVG
jgi:hypothetical protein